MIRWLFRVIYGDFDPAWKPTGVKPAYTGHDESKAVQSAERADREAMARMKLAAKRSQPQIVKAKPSRVLAMPRRSQK